MLMHSHPYVLDVPDNNQLPCYHRAPAAQRRLQQGLSPVTINSTIVRWEDGNNKPTTSCSLDNPSALLEGVFIQADSQVLPPEADKHICVGELGFLPLRFLTVRMAPLDFKQAVAVAPTGCGLSDQSTAATSPQANPPRRVMLPKLGNRGRAKLRGRIAAAARGYSREWRAAMGIGCLKTATVAQLIHMADKVGLGDYVDALAKEQFGGGLSYSRK
ncbi:hypothetical protein FOL47_001272 [Perkinsus chesapeaki]|uniref:Uncharacterized protein n=1 Tax=Perkinsus chesapeaki TaxID=330153 RepID=A0A7J6N1I4_PERCH|nr:hypothetical protein FOL47_001272 [Perkinsus chesapeaki]